MQLGMKNITYDHLHTKYADPAMNSLYVTHAVSS